jgi:hypothetical protein
MMNKINSKENPLINCYKNSIYYNKILRSMKIKMTKILFII